MCSGLFVSVSLQSYPSSKGLLSLGRLRDFPGLPLEEMCVYKHSLGPTSANSAGTFLRWQLLLGCCQGTKHFLPFHLSPADPLEADDDYRLTQSFSKTGACCPGHEAG